MNANDYQNDPLSKGDPCNQISARCDLASNGYAFGGIDSKNVDHVMVKNQVSARGRSLVSSRERSGCGCVRASPFPSDAAMLLPLADDEGHLRPVARKRARL